MRRAAVPQLLDNDHIGKSIEARAAILLRNDNAHESRVAHFLGEREVAGAGAFFIAIRKAEMRRPHPELARDGRGASLHLVERLLG